MPIRRKKKIRMLIPLASMGDIAFLLIIFFMLVSSFMKNVEVDQAASPDVEQLETAQISVIVDKDVRIWLQGIEVGVGEVGPAVEILVGERRQDTPVHLTIQKELKKKDYMPVISALSSAGVKLVLVGQQTDS